MGIPQEGNNGLLHHLFVNLKGRGLFDSEYLNKSLIQFMLHFQYLHYFLYILTHTYRVVVTPSSHTFTLKVIPFNNMTVIFLYGCCHLLVSLTGDSCKPNSRHSNNVQQNKVPMAVSVYFICCITGLHNNFILKL